MAMEAVAAAVLEKLKSSAKVVADHSTKKLENVRIAVEQDKFADCNFDTQPTIRGTVEKLIDIYFWPGEWVGTKFVCGPSALRLVTLALIVVPPIFWLSVLALIVVALSVVL